MDNLVFSIELDDNNNLDDDNFRDFQSIIRFLSEEQCRKTLRLLILGQPCESAEQALLARIADFIALGPHEYADLPRDVATEKLKSLLTEDNLREAWNKCGL